MREIDSYRNPPLPLRPPLPFIVSAFVGSAFVGSALVGSALVGSALLACPALAQSSTETIAVPRLTGPITVDGRVDEAAWDAVAPLPLVTHWPTFGDAPSEPTEIRLAYDDDAVYLSCRCYAPPEAIYAASFQRDLFTLGTDYLAIALDTYDDNENGVYFLVSPTGSRTDAAISNDAVANTDPSWNTFWDTETTITDVGWFAEMRIPFSSLRYQTENGRVVMGVSAFRYLGKKNELDVFPAIPPNWGFDSMVKPSKMQNVSFEGLGSRRPIYVAPYALGGVGQTYDMNAAESAFVRTDDTVTEIGADIKMGITDDLTLDLTLNTDFAQVEADDAQVNLTRFSLFFPERRQFFLERASLFDVNLGGDNRLFYSRRIGLADGEPVRLLGGGRLVGRMGPWDVGVINLQTARRPGLDPSDRIASENFGVLRLRRQFVNATSTIGGMATSRVTEDGGANVAIGLDTDINVLGSAFLTLNAVQTVDRDPNRIDETRPGTRLRAGFERRAYVGTSYDFGAIYSDSGYLPGLGYEQRSDYSAFRGQLSHGWGGSEGSPFQKRQVSVSSLAFVRLEDGSTETIESDLKWEGQFTSGTALTASANVTFEDLRDGFSFSDDVDVLPGRYTFASAAGSYEMPGGKVLRTALNANAGTFYDGWRLTLGISPEWTASKYLALKGGYEFNRIGFPDRDQLLVAHVAKLEVRAALNTRWSLSSVGQVNSAADAGLLTMRLRYNPREGNDFYLVINESFHTDRFRQTPAFPFTNQRTILAKYTRTFAF